MIMIMMIIIIEHSNNSITSRLGSASERAKGRGASLGKVGSCSPVLLPHVMLLARLGMGEGERANVSAGSRA